MAWTAGERADQDRAARLVGAAGKVKQSLDTSPAELRWLARSHQDCAARARRELGGRAFATAFRAGAKLDLDRALTYALEGEESGPPAR